MTAQEPINGDAFIAQFMDDYFAECDEHITNMRRCLLALDTAIGEAVGDQHAIGELFRSLHTVKGLSGMVRVAPAEQLAHQLESYVRNLRDSRATLTQATLGTLSEGIHLLEQVLGARRGNTPLPDLSPFLQQFATPEAAPPPPAPTAVASVEETTPTEEPALQETEASAGEAVEQGAQVYRFRFSPSAELAARGINVDTIRGRLRNLGEIRAAVPQVSGKGVVFEFTVVTHVAEDAFAPLAQDGVHWELVTHPPAAAAEPTGRSAAGEHPATLTPPNVVRVDLARVDELLRLVGDLVISRARLEDGLNALAATATPSAIRPLQETSQAIERQLRSLRESIMRIRMVPIGDVFQRMHFVIRDLARESGKQVSLRLEGHTTEIDKLVVERMMDPLLHLVRNAVSHGLEPPEERERQGKLPVGTLWLRARTAGDSVIIEIKDDGRGIDMARVANKARAVGLLAGDEGVTDDTLLDILCAPGFSTRDDADRAAGRGMGMAIVRSTVRELGGELSLRTEQGKGTAFIIQLPLTLAIVNAILVRCGGRLFAMPQPSVREVIPLETAAITVLENNEIVPYRGRTLPLLRLARLFNLPSPPTETAVALVVGEDAANVGIVVDKIAGQREIVVRALNDPLVQVPGVSGATELGDGRVVLILDAAGLIREARRAPSELTARPRTQSPETAGA